MFAYQKGERRFGVVQGCCNSWNCPRCGVQRAKAEYGRIVQGCVDLAKKHDLWFITVTCRGKVLTKNEADAGYGEWTNRLLTRWRTYASRKGAPWHYVQVTERQKRGHPHSHILTTFCPPEVVQGTKTQWKTDSQGRRFSEETQALRSDYVRRSVVGAGLGDQYDISRVASVQAASRYVAKYLFKDTIFNTVWPDGWKRVRYSQTFPKLPDRKTEAFVLLKREDWTRLAYAADVIVATDDITKNTVYNAIGYTGVVIK